MITKKSNKSINGMGATPWSRISFKKVKRATEAAITRIREYSIFLRAEKKSSVVDGACMPKFKLNLLTKSLITSQPPSIDVKSSLKESLINPLPYYLAYYSMKKILFAFLVLSGSLLSAQIQLSDKAEVSIITCGPTQAELYSAFGHSAIRIYDSLKGIDDAYNYGLFSFDQPNFYLNFARGSSFYILGVQSYPDFRYTYIYYNRSLHEQKLNLTPEQKQKVFDFLQWNARPENRSYRYDYFYDNCATRVRDAFEKALPGEVRFDSTYITTDYSIRDLTEIYLQRQPWGDLGIDICLGLPMDKKASPYEYMFLPDYIESSFDHATINGSSLVKTKNIVYEAKPETVKGPPHPWGVFGILLGITIGLSFYDWKRKKLSKWFDVILFSVAGWIGIVLILLWTATDHKAAANNLNLLWAFPLHAVAAIMLLRRKPSSLLVKYFTATEIVLGVTLLFWFLIPQQLNPFLIPVVSALLLRAFLISYILKNKNTAVQH